MVRAKFYVDSITDYGDDAKEIVLRAVTSGSEENKTFWKYTPSGELRMTISNNEASKQFANGQEFYIDFTPADE